MSAAEGARSIELERVKGERDAARNAKDLAITAWELECASVKQILAERDELRATVADLTALDEIKDRVIAEASARADALAMALEPFDRFADARDALAAWRAAK